MNLVDPEGLTIVIKDYASLRNVLNTLSDVDSKQIVLTNDGALFVNSNHMSNSKAFGALKTLSESSITYFILVLHSCIIQMMALKFFNTEIPSIKELH